MFYNQLNTILDLIMAMQEKCACMFGHIDNKLSSVSIMHNLIDLIHNHIQELLFEVALGISWILAIAYISF